MPTITTASQDDGTNYTMTATAKTREGKILHQFSLTVPSKAAKDQEVLVGLEKATQGVVRSML